MMNGADGAVLRQVNRLFGPGTVAGLSEGELLERFVARRDEAAFEALVARHGPMVLGVCRRALRDPHDADDAFQATFLILARRAGAIRDGDLLARWLFGVARRVSARARVLAGRRRDRERPAPSEPAGPDLDPAGWEVRSILDEEIGRLGETYRSPVVLCYLEGLSHEEAARRLGWPVGTVKGRLSRARDLLRSRLSRRGLGVPAAALALAAIREASAAVPEALILSTTRAALPFAAGGAAAGLLPAAAASLARGTLRTMTMTKLKVLSAAVLTLGLAAGGAGLVAQSGKARVDAAEGQAVEGQPPGVDPARDDPAGIQGLWEITGRVDQGKPAEVAAEYRPVLILPDAIYTVAGAGGSWRLEGMPYTLISGHEARWIDITRPSGPEKGKVERGIYRREGDLLTIVHTLGGTDRPADFAPLAGRTVLTLRRNKTPGVVPLLPAEPPGRPITPAADSRPATQRRPPADSDLAPPVVVVTAPELEARLKHAQRSLELKQEMANFGRLNRHEVLDAQDELDNLQAQVRGMSQAMLDQLEILQAQLAAKDAELQKAEAQVQLSKAVTARLARLAERAVVSREETAKAEGEAEIAEAQRDVRKAEVQEAAIRLNQAKRRVAEFARLQAPKAPPAPETPPPPAAPPAERPAPAHTEKAEDDPRNRPILERLDRTADLTLEDVDFWEAIKAIQVAAGDDGERGFAFLFNHEELEDRDQAAHARVNLAVRGVPVGTALRLALGQLGLTYRVEGGLVKFVGKPGAPGVNPQHGR